MIVCSSNQVSEARVAHPDAFILCDDARVIHVPGSTGTIIRLSAARIARTLKRPDVERFEPSDSD